MSPTIELTHFLRGKMRVRIAEDHTFWLKGRHWTDVDSDGEVYEDGDFEETRAEIDALFSTAEKQSSKEGALGSAPVPGL